MIALPAIIFILLLNQSNQRFESIMNPTTYADMACSFRGEYNLAIYQSTKEIVCDCDSDFATLDEGLYFTIFGGTSFPKLKIQCNYVRKRRSILVFLTAIQPLGFEFFYIGYNFFFSILFIYGIVTLCGNLYCYIDAPEKNYMKSKYNLIFFIMLMVLLGVHILKLGLIFTITEDSNGIEIFDDVDYLVSLK